MSAPSNDPSGTPRRRRNPLVWGIFVAIGALLPPWQFRDVSDLMMPAGGVAFLLLYFAKSRFAWHALAAHLLIIVPVYVFLSPSWRLQRLLDPSIIWFPILYTAVAIVFLIWSRTRYPAYLKKRREAPDA